MAVSSLTSQVRRARSHACSLAFWYSSDELPPPWVERAYLTVFATEKWPNGLLASASNLTSTLTGLSTGVKMSGPYQWVPPVFWLGSLNAPILRGGAFGFLTEGGPGAAIQTWESLQLALGPDDWPLDNKAWMYDWANPV